VPSTCDGVELTNPTFPAANASVVYKEFSPDSGASVCHIFTCLRLCRSLGFFKHRASARSRSRVTRVPARASPAQTLRRGRAGTRVASPAVATRGLDPAGDSPPRGPSLVSTIARTTNLERQRSFFGGRRLGVATKKKGVSFLG
jgi:hypothetical protein